MWFKKFIASLWSASLLKLSQQLLSLNGDSMLSYRARYLYWTIENGIAKDSDKHVPLSPYRALNSIRFKNIFLLLYKCLVSVHNQYYL